METHDDARLPIGSIRAQQVRTLLRERGLDAASVEFVFDPWDHVTTFVVRNARGVATGTGSIVIVSTYEADRIAVRFRVGDVTSL